ncbi:biotin-dependent carboxyltransferase family protein [Nocardia brasiliensis]|uniref:5-oxoprolinase subunit C family protein n=1 Tax=Nocardia brasiliensis TaxID=37326 RepID=UPI0018956A60|nr:biotin-dependent carboxyltransferase family protein [Nocardia brasiliensis]MBF6127662.1 biotin-dependent carboxyltransferase family protein [Nocardia brasiliensis]MBF6547970.1 biotin-dependent carboxyltransferase family protein [Nocardia brasiliensis]
MSAGHAALRVDAAGALSTIQDLGRPGWFAIGVGVSGAADRGALKLANRLVGNPEQAAGIETLLGGLELTALAPVLLAVTGADAPITVDGVPQARAAVLALATGQQLKLGMATAGLRAYVGVRGGIAAEPVLGSCSTDTLAGLGPAALTGGTELAVGSARTYPWPNVAVAPVPSPDTGTVEVRVLLGPRDDWFTDPRALCTGAWAMTDRADRVGVRLTRVGEHPPLTRINDKELPTEGMALGAIQVQPSGEPVVFLADHPITGGYPVVGTVVSADVDLLAQLRPGQQVRFRLVAP